MVGSRMEQELAQRMHTSYAQILGMAQSRILELPEEDFRRLIDEVEQSPLFHRLYYQERLIRHAMPHPIYISRRLFCLDEDLLPAASPAEVESFLAGKGAIIRQIQKLGEAKFSKYFLFPESNLTLAEIARACGLELSVAEAINSLVNEFAVLSEFCQVSPTMQAISYTRTAAVESRDGELTIIYFSRTYARGAYEVDYARFEELRASGGFTPDETRMAKGLFAKLELINHRKNTIHRILQCLVARQSRYLKSADPLQLVPCCQRELAAELGLAPSTISRAIRYRSLVSPWGKELPLKDLLPKPRALRKRFLSRLLHDEPHLSSDTVISQRLREKYGLDICRRTVAALRKELGIPVKRVEKR